MFDLLKKSNGEREGSTRKPWIVLLGAVLGILLLLFGSGVGKAQSNTNTPQIPATQQNEMTDYQQYLEERVVSICSSVAGVGKVSAIVTLAGGFEAVYATELQKECEDYVILGNGSNERLHVHEQRN